MFNSIKEELRNHSSEEKAKLLAGFFKTGKGQYGEGDKFLGVMVPETRKIARKYLDISFEDILRLMKDEFHEVRLAGLLIWVDKFKKADSAEKKKIYELYLDNAKLVNNWDLVDLTSHKIVGEYLVDKDKSVLFKLAKSENLWERRISIISTFAFIHRGHFKESFEIAEILLNDKHDLIHKAVGWVLREIGKKDRQAEEEFLVKHYKTMPRTMLRYAIEKFSEDKKKFYMAKPFSKRFNRK